MSAVDRPGEFDLIEQYFKPLASSDGAFDLEDDAATFTPPPGHDLVVSVDTLVAGVHFFIGDPADLIARKALRVNLSDLVAKGAKPIGYLLSLGLPEDWTEGWVRRFCAGLEIDQHNYGFSLLGGDTVKSPERFVITITVIGHCPHKAMVRRGTAQAGDNIVVSGTIGDAALGLICRRFPEEAGDVDLDEPHRMDLVGRYQLPEPPLAGISALREFAQAAMDISDGLVGDLEKMCIASGTGARVHSDRIPLSPAATIMISGDDQLFKTAISGGDDYELLTSVSQQNTAPFLEALAQAGVTGTVIGEMTENAGKVQILDAAGAPMVLEHGSYRHF